MDSEKFEQAFKQINLNAALCVETCLFYIDNEGRWFYQGEPLPTKFARLFSSILHGIEGEHFLITPVEKLKVAVSSTPLLIVDYQQQKSGQFLLTTSLGTEFELEDFHSFSIEDEGVYMNLPRGLSAKLGRACFYRFVEQYLTDLDSYQ
ncbi:DUF1285 domain-containing protein [Shewanella sp. UCD-KL12]|uniref:DUF1285 domain-containing protein n=1 Tax=Shewanella sp. UCD-KL12 TaxID=1917163 RepID=UPI000970D7F3|nr:DUF1285 domain-containing protein [Shewanella sp. UCD-KL12]